MKIIIFGATGGTGQELVKQALEKGHTVTVLARNPAKVEVKHANLSVIKGDVLDATSVENAVTGHGAVLVALGVKPPSRAIVVGPGTKNIINAMKKHGVKRLIVESAMFLASIRSRAF